MNTCGENIGESRNGECKPSCCVLIVFAPSNTVETAAACARVPIICYTSYSDYITHVFQVGNVPCFSTNRFHGP